MPLQLMQAQQQIHPRSLSSSDSSSVRGSQKSRSLSSSLWTTRNAVVQAFTASLLFAWTLLPAAASIFFFQSMVASWNDFEIVTLLQTTDEWMIDVVESDFTFDKTKYLVGRKIESSQLRYIKYTIYEMMLSHARYIIKYARLIYIRPRLPILWQERTKFCLAWANCQSLTLPKIGPDGYEGVLFNSFVQNAESLAR
jgi:hypothetical protein